MVITSKLTGKSYEDEDCIKIPNQLQVYKYLINALEPIDVIYSDRLVFVFDRASSKPLFDKWCRHVL